MKNRQNSRSAVSAFIITLLLPFAGLFVSLNKWKQHWAKNVFWLVCIYMAFIHIYAPVDGGGADIERYVSMLDFMSHQYSSISQALEANKHPDYYQPILTFLVSRFTDEGHILFLIFGFVYGFFYSRNIWFVLERLPERFPRILFILIATFILVCPIWNIGGVRMWTALQVFCYGTLPYLLDKDRKKIIWVFASIFIHFSFIMPAILFGVFWILPERIKSGTAFLRIMFVLFLISSFVNILNLQQIGEIIQNIAPDLFEDNIAGYLGEQYVEKIQELSASHSLFYKVSDFVSKYECLVLTIFSYCIIKKDDSNTKDYKRIFSCSLLLYSAGNILSIAPSGGRFIVIAQMIILPVIILVFAHIGYKHFKLLIHFVLYTSIILIVFRLRAGAECYGINLLLGNFFTAMPLETNVSFIYTLKQLF